MTVEMRLRVFRMVGRLCWMVGYVLCGLALRHQPVGVAMTMGAGLLLVAVGGVIGGFFNGIDARRV